MPCRFLAAGAVHALDGGGQDVEAIDGDLGAALATGAVGAGVELGEGGGHVGTHCGQQFDGAEAGLAFGVGFEGIGEGAAGLTEVLDRLSCERLEFGVDLGNASFEDGADLGRGTHDVTVRNPCGDEEGHPTRPRWTFGPQPRRYRARVLDTYGWDDRVAVLAAGVGPDAVVGRVVRVDRGVYTVATTDGLVGTALSGAVKHVRDPADRPTIGDWVCLDDARELVTHVLRRWSVFLRGDIDRLQAQAVAADVDVVFVVHTASLEPNLRRLERELVLAHQSGAQPVVVLSKADLCPDPTAARALVVPYAPGVDVLLTSAVSGVGVDTVAGYGHGGRTLACIGASGVGKSTLVNALLGSDVQAIGAIRDFDGKGRHTTSARSLHPLPGGGVLIDTPGFRSVGMWRSDEGLAAAFADVELLARGCRFSDCTHDHEPGCAVLAAVERGEVDGERVAHMRSLISELDRIDDETEARGRVLKQQERARRRLGPTIT